MRNQLFDTEEDGKVSVENSTEEMLEDLKDRRSKALLRPRDVKDLLPDKARLTDRGELKVESSSYDQADTATLTDLRKGIVEYLHDNPVATERKASNDLGCSRSHVRGTREDFGFLLTDEALFEAFIRGAYYDSDDVWEVKSCHEEIPDIVTTHTTLEGAREAASLQYEKFGNVPDIKTPSGGKYEYDADEWFSDVVEVSGVEDIVEVEDDAGGWEEVPTDDTEDMEVEPRKGPAFEFEDQDDAFEFIRSFIVAGEVDKARRIFKQFT